MDGEWRGNARVAHGVDRWTLNLSESGGTLTGSYTVITAVLEPDPVSYSGAVTGSFTAASVFQDPSYGLYGPPHPASLRLDARVDFGGGLEGSCRYDARLSDDLDAIVVDGVPIDPVSAGWVYQTSSHDIYSIRFLYGGEAILRFGHRGANGVLLIETHGR